MGKIRISSPNPNVTGYVDMEVLLPEIVEGFWEDKDGRRFDSGETAHLENTVYFRIRTRRIRDGETLQLQLWEYDTFTPDEKKFDGEEVNLTATVSGNEAVVELPLPDNWLQEVKNNYGTLRLFWKVTAFGKLSKKLPEKKADYLHVGASDKYLYVMPSALGDGFPEMYSFEGEMLFVAKVAVGESNEESPSSGVAELAGFGLDNVRDEALEAVSSKLTHHLTLNKLEKGYLLGSNGEILRNKKKLKTEYYTNTSGGGGFEKVATKQGRPVYFKTENGAFISTNGLNQYECISRAGARMKILGALRHVGAVVDLFNLADYAMSENKQGGSLPPILPGSVAPIAIAGELLIERNLGFLDGMFDEAARQTLQETKAEGVKQVEMYLRTPAMREMGYEILEISNGTASKLLQGEFKTRLELEHYQDKHHDQNNRDIKLLCKRTLHPIRGGYIDLIETFFIEYEK